MEKEPEPKTSGDKDTPSFSVDEQLDVFKKQLDEVPSMITIPGFLFRNGEGYRFRGKFSSIDWGLVEQHAETYKQALEARDQLLGRIKPIEILDMVRAIWGKGEIIQTSLGSIITYYYLSIKEEMEMGGGTTTEHRNGIAGASVSYHTSPTYLYKTGKWEAERKVAAMETIAVGYGNAIHPYHYDFRQELSGIASTLADRREAHLPSLDDFFADSYRNSPYGGEGYFKGIPSTIWRRPDNLGVDVSGTWFDQSVSQQEIMDYLTRKLEAQKTTGQIPSQIEAVEFAKIEELKRRGLFSRTSRWAYQWDHSKVKRFKD